MKILFLCTFYHRAMLFRQQMDFLNDKGHEVLAFNSTYYGDKIAPKFISIMDGKVIHKECWGKIDRVLFFPRQWKVEKELLKSYKIKDFDLIHSHLLLTSGYTAMRMKEKYGIPYVVSIRNTDINGFLKVPGFSFLANRILENASGVLFLSNTYKRTLFNEFVFSKNKSKVENKSVVIGNSVESFWKEHLSLPKKHSSESSEIRILTVAKIKPIKNIPTAAKAVMELKKRGYKAYLTVVGENQNDEEYKRIADFDCVKMLPFKNQVELLKLYHDHDIFLLPSREETFGRVYVEAMTQGLPVIYTQNEGFDGNYEEGLVGYSVPVNNSSVIADRLEDVLTNYNQISKNCILHASDFFEENIANKLEEFYVNAIHQ